MALLLRERGRRPHRRRRSAARLFRTARGLNAARAVAAAALVVVLAVPAAVAAAEPPGDGQLGDVTGFSADGAVFTFSSGTAKARVAFDLDDQFRLQVAPDGVFTDPANTPPQDPSAPSANIVIKTDYPAPAASHTETDDAYVLATASVRVVAHKSPLTFEVFRSDGTPVWRETSPVSWAAGDGGWRTTQHLARGPREQFFGGGMQNGRFSHRGETIRITNPDGWEDGDVPNASPYYMSTAGYGVLRNTFASGEYSFGEPLSTTHDEDRFDAYFFVGDLKTSLDRYTALTGRPMMPPVYGMELGDADCYLHNANRGERTPEDAVAVAQGYVDNDMPRGWMLVNDGYGCGYERLDWMGDELRERDIQLGLWTEDGLPDQEYEVGTAGLRVRKLDVAWVGDGYRHALSGCEEAHGGIEDYSDARGYSWTVAGWAGTQRCAVQWTGDHAGSLDAIRWQIPAIHGSGLSGIAYSAGDIDGIFGGSAESYVRDLQWKAFTPALMSMSGWAASDKQPWAYGEPYTDINRDYLRLRERLLPYLYTYAAEAHETGAPINRSLVLEYPDDPNTWGEKAAYEFLAGEDFLVAPVYERGSTRDGIYLPEGTWVDYWSGRLYEGPVTVDGYHAPLDRLPLFVRAGAIVPMWPEGTNNHADVDSGDRLTLDVYPRGDSEFVLYEDDGLTRRYAGGESSRQLFEVSAPESGRGTVTATIGAVSGSFEGQAGSRPYELTMHTGDAPVLAQFGRSVLKRYTDREAYEAASTGWFFGDGVARVKTPSVGAAKSATVTLRGASAVGGAHPEADAVSTRVEFPDFAPGGQELTARVSFTNETGGTLRGVRLGLDLPEGWTSSPGTRTLPKVRDGETVTAGFTVVPGDTPGVSTVVAEAEYSARLRERRVESSVDTLVPFAGLSAAVNNTGVSDDADTTAANLDGGGSSFSAQALAAAGLVPGEEFAFGGATFTWPSSAGGGSADNVTGAGQSVLVSGSGSKLALLATGTGQNAGGPLTVRYTDGTSETLSMSVPNWCCLPTGDTQVAVRVKGKNTAAGPGQYPTVEYRIYYLPFEVDPARTVQAITLPDNATVHVFAVAVGW
ncbi:TIM-barrel domain-containing protein [Phytomonospora endophytica]|uniref:Alpha-glucosidase (Family GH31 glycosyl hydrolase) n=1 Tax=Phytomonospora endophytica TaxID=714109 RepID=A0A841FJ77_9ACTN|nr:TIM-barrel domain-containing protein [Phytomonospora endophytica]MBB6033888.1 alpha-glucosidase (family GH31 glycosyl hydrolase) [Phytomonospora endophytica]